METYFAFSILFATIAGSFCVEPINVEATTQQSNKEAQPQKRSLSALHDCDGPGGVIGVHGGLHSDVSVHDDLALGLHGSYAPSYAPSYASSYGGGYLGSSLASGGYLGSSSATGSYLGSGLATSGYAGSSLATSGILGHIGSAGHVDTFGAVVGAPSVLAGGYSGGYASGYAPHAPISSSSIVSHGSVITAPSTIAVAPSVTKVVSHPVPVPFHVDRPVPVPYPVAKPVPFAVPVDRPVYVPKPVAVPHPVPYPVHHLITKKVTVPYPVVVPSPSVSYSAPVVVGHGSYDHSYGNRFHGSGLYSSSSSSSFGSYGSPLYSSSGIKVISPTYKSYYGGSGYGHSSSNLHGGYHGGVSYGGGINHGGEISHGGLGLSIGSKYGWPLKFGLKYQHWK